MYEGTLSEDEKVILANASQPRQPPVQRQFIPHATRRSFPLSDDSDTSDSNDSDLKTRYTGHIPMLSASDLLAPNENCPLMSMIGFPRGHNVQDLYNAIVYKYRGPPALWHNEPQGFLDMSFDTNDLDDSDYCPSTDSDEDTHPSSTSRSASTSNSSTTSNLDPGNPPVPSPSRVGSGRHPVLPPLDQLVITLFVLRTGVTARVTAYLFRISRTSISRYFLTWIRALKVFFTDVYPRQLG